MYKKIFISMLAGCAAATPVAAAPVIWAGNGHAYEYIGQGVTWDAARAAALGMSFNGQQGYLVTITSQAEQDFIFNSVTALSAWAGGSDANVEGTWMWVDGPEAGTTFWQAGVGTLTYSNWAGAEPNNLGGENSLQLNFSGDRWNDSNAGAALGYVVEYNGISMGVPEPSAWALFILGFGAVGGALRRGRKARVALTYA